MIQDSILFQKKTLTVSREKVVAGATTIYYPNIEGVGVYSGKPFFVTGVVLLVGACLFSLVPMFLISLLGSAFSFVFLLGVMPLVAMAIFCLVYRSSYVYISVGGRIIPVLKSENPETLELAKETIDQARREHWR